jgi:hypothetical protein
MKAKLLLFALMASLVSPITSSAATDHLVISQIQVSGDNGSGDEFIELYNPTAAAVSLLGWSIQYKSSTGVFPLTTGKKNLPDVQIPAGRYYLIAPSTYNGTVLADLIQSSVSLSSSTGGGTVFLVNSTSFLDAGDDPSIVDKVGYGDSLTNSFEAANAPLPPSESALIRTGDDTDNNLADFQILVAAPRNSAYVPSTDPGNGGDDGTNPGDDTTNPPGDDNDDQNPPPATELGKIVISELAVNSAGADKQFIELANIGGSNISIKGWSISNLEKTYTIQNEVLLKPGEYFVVYKRQSKITLNNDGPEKVTIMNSSGNLVDTVEYLKGQKASSYSRVGNAYCWTTTKTPGMINDCSE